MPDSLPIRGEHIDLDQLLKLANLADSGGHAKHLIQSGRVTVNGQTETRRRRKVRPGDAVAIEGGPTILVTPM